MYRLLFALILCVWVQGCVTVTEDQDKPNFHSDLSTNGRIPKAKGDVLVTANKMNTNSVDITVKNLVNPQRLNRKAHNYVVWESFGGVDMKPQSVGALNLDGRGTGRLQTATPFRNFDLFITAEPSMVQKTPTGEKLFWVSVNH